MPLGVGARNVEQVDSCENDKKSTKKRDCINRIGGIESAVQNERSSECRSREGNVVNWINTR